MTPTNPRTWFFGKGRAAAPKPAAPMAEPERLAKIKQWLKGHAVKKCEPSPVPEEPKQHLHSPRARRYE